MDAYSLVALLLGENNWWLWLAIIVFQYEFYKSFKPRGKVLVIPLEKIKDVWFAGKPQFVKMTRPLMKWRRTKGEGHLLERTKSGFIQTGFFSHPVLFVNTKKTRTMTVNFEEVEHSEDKKKGAPRNGASDSFDDFANEEAYLQGKKANSTAKTPVGMLLLAAISAGAIAFMIAWIMHPAQCPPDFSCIPLPGVGGNGAVTTTITSSTVAR